MDYPERKYFDTVIATSSIINAGTIIANSLNIVQEGAGPDNCFGRKINIKRISIKFQLVRDSILSLNSGDLQGANVRIMLVLDMQTNGANPSIPLLMDTPSVVGFFNLENSRRYKVLKEWNVSMNHQGGGPVQVGNGGLLGTVQYWGTGVRRYFKWSKRCNIRIDFGKPTTGNPRTITQVKTNNLFLFGTASNGTDFVGITRIRFTDE